MADKSIREQISELPHGPQRRLAELMDEVYQREFMGVWPEDPRYDVLEHAIVEAPQVLGPSFYIGRITDAERQRLARLVSEANGWFYHRHGMLVFATPVEWERVKHISSSSELA